MNKIFSGVSKQLCNTGLLIHHAVVLLTITDLLRLPRNVLYWGSRKFLNAEASIAELFGMRAPWHNCSSSRVWLSDRVGSISPAWPAMKRREGLRVAGVPSPDSLLMVAKGGLKFTDSSSSKREVAVEAELCELAFFFLIKKSCTFLLRCTFSCGIHCHHLENLHLHPNQMALSWCSLLGAASTLVKAACGLLGLFGDRLPSDFIPN